MYSSRKHLASHAHNRRYCCELPPDFQGLRQLCMDLSSYIPKVCQFGHPHFDWCISTLVCLRDVIPSFKLETVLFSVKGLILLFSFIGLANHNHCGQYTYNTKEVKLIHFSDVHTHSKILIHF